MKDLKSLQEQREALNSVLEQAIRDQKDPIHTAEIQKQSKAVEKMIYERITLLQKGGLYEEGQN